MKETGQSTRVYGLDIMRTLAILPVVAIHAGYFLQNIDPHYPWIHLYEGVDVFFVLSGFLIGSILLKTYSGENEFTFSTVFSFLKRRWFRTLPNYFLVLALNLVLIYFGITEGNLKDFSWKFLIFCQNLVTPFYGFFWESWSLTIEEWFYLLFPFILLLLVGIFKNRISRKHLFLAGILVFLVVPLVLRIYRGMQVTVDFSDWDNSFKKIVPMRLDAIGWGILAAYLKFYHQQFFYRYKNILFLLGIAGYILLYNISADINSMYTKAYVFSLMGIAITLTVPGFDSIKQGKGILAKAVTHISKISYSMYLVNLGIVAQIINAQANPQTSGEAILMYIIYWAAVIVLSTLIYKFYEKPIMDLRDRKMLFARPMKSGEKS